MKGWTSSSKQQEATPETKIKQIGDSFRTYEKKVKRAALKWDGFVLQEKFKSLLYVDRSLCGDTNM